MARKIGRMGPVGQITKIVGQFDSLITKLGNAVAEAGAEKEASRQRVEEARKRFAEFEGKERTVQYDLSAAMDRAESLVQGLTKLLQGK